MNARRLAVSLVLGTLWLVGCAPIDRPRVPDAPSARITAAASVPAVAHVVSCTGSSAQIAALGALCTGGASAFHRIGVPTSGAMRIGASDGSPYLVIVGYPPAGSPEDGPFDASRLGYAAFMVTNGPRSGVVPALEAWRGGTELSGSLVSTSFSLGACSTGWVGGGTLVFGDVTLTLSWASAIPC